MPTAVVYPTSGRSVQKSAMDPRESNAPHNHRYTQHKTILQLYASTFATADSRGTPRCRRSDGVAHLVDGEEVGALGAVGVIPLQTLMHVCLALAKLAGQDLIDTAK